MLNPESVELSVVMPCLNEAETLATCIVKARRGIDAAGVRGEIIVADNGSTDGSQEIARANGARVVDVPTRGYGSALRGGIEAARGELVIMADADDSYDFSALEPFVTKLREGWDVVMGNRFLGGIKPGAMPFKNRYLGNPVLTFIGRLFFDCPVGDFHCGMRAFTRTAYRRMELRTPGMEFASEMVIRSTVAGLKITEVPIFLYPDGRSRPPHLRPWRDGWRHLRFMLLLSPRWLFFVPGSVLFGIGLTVCALLVKDTVGVFDIHTLLVAGFLCVIGYQIIIFAACTQRVAERHGLLRPSAATDLMNQWLSLELGLIIGLLVCTAGTGLIAIAFTHWRAIGFGNLDPKWTMRQVIPAVVLLMFGVQTVFASFFFETLKMVERRDQSRAQDDTITAKTGIDGQKDRSS